MSKPKFDPNQSYDVADKPPFDSEQGFEPVEEFSLETALRSFGNNAAFGMADHARAFTEPAVFGALNLLTGNDVESEGDYISRRDEELKKTQELSAKNPTSAASGAVAGTVAGMAIPGISLFKGAKPLARIAATAGNAGLMGALQNTGDVEGEFNVDPLGRIKNAGVGAVFGAGLQSLGEGAVKAFKGAPKNLDYLANEKAVKATGAMKKDFKYMPPGKVQELGNTLLEDGIVTPLAKPEDMALRLSEKISKTSDDLGNQLQKADDVLWRPEGFNMENATTEQLKAFNKAFVPTSEVKDGLIRNFLKENDGVPIEELQPAIDKIEIWFKGKPEHMSVGELQNMKVGMNNFLKKSDFYKYGESGMTPMAKEGLMSVRRGVKDSIESKANNAAEIMGEQGGQIKNTNKKFGQYLEAQDLTEDAIARNASNREISLTDYLMMIAGGNGGGIPGAIVSAGANKLTRGYGNQMAATGAKYSAKQLRGIDKFIESSPVLKEALQKSPGGVSSVIQNILARGEQTFEEGAPKPPMQQNIPVPRQAEDQTRPGASTDKQKIIQKAHGSKYGQILQNASSRGDNAFNASVYILQQRDPEFRKQMEEDQQLSIFHWVGFGYISVEIGC